MSNKITENEIKVVYSKLGDGCMIRATATVSAWVYSESLEIGQPELEAEAKRLMLLQIYGEVENKFAMIKLLLEHKISMGEWGAASFDKQMADKIREVLNLV